MMRFQTSWRTCMLTVSFTTGVHVCVRLSPSESQALLAAFRLITSILVHPLEGRGPTETRDRKDARAPWYQVTSATPLPVCGKVPHPCWVFSPHFFSVDRGNGPQWFSMWKMARRVSCPGIASIQPWKSESSTTDEAQLYPWGGCAVRSLRNGTLNKHIPHRNESG